MTYNSAIHHRRSIRLKGYDYSRAGAYFVTIRTQNWACLFGKIENGVMILNDAGCMVEKWYRELELLKRLLNDEIKNRAKTNMIQGKKFSKSGIVIKTKGDDRDYSDSKTKLKLGEARANKAGSDQVRIYYYRKPIIHRIL